MNRGTCRWTTICVVPLAKLPAGPSVGYQVPTSHRMIDTCCSLHACTQAQSDHLNAAVRALTQADPGDVASAPLDPQGARYKRLVQDLKLGFAPAPTRQLPSQARPLPCTLCLGSLPGCVCTDVVWVQCCPSHTMCTAQQRPVHASVSCHLSSVNWQAALYSLRSSCAAT